MPKIKDEITIHSSAAEYLPMLLLSVTVQTAWKCAMRTRIYG